MRVIAVEMGNPKTRSYKASVNWKSALRGALGVFTPLASALVWLSALSCALSCADADSGPRPQGSAAGTDSAAESAGAAGSEDPATGEGGSAGFTDGEGGREEHAGEGGTGGASGAGGDTNPGGTGGGGSPPKVCSRDSDCNDGLFCNGEEVCNPRFKGADVKVCMRSEHGPCEPSPCDEAKRECDCSVGDRDGDGYNVSGCANGEPVDCDDTDIRRNPGQVEVCDVEQLDEDCDEDTFGFADANGNSTDRDEDGFFDSSCANKLRYQPIVVTLASTFSSQTLMNRGSDCDDHNFTVNPHAPETCNGIDDNCNGEIDEVSGGQGDPHTYYIDQDGDYYGSDDNPLSTLCNSAPPGYSVQHGDCDDSNPRINPGREEICDGLDNDCGNGIDLPEKPGDLIFGQPYDGVTGFECTGHDGWKVKTCPSPLLDCNANYHDACETIGTTLCNCHACGRTCAFSCGAENCEEIRVLSTGDKHTCAIFMSTAQEVAAVGGRVACWGRNSDGQLGNEKTSDSGTPVLVPSLAKATAVALGERHSCVITLDSGALCWGNNDQGQLGAASTKPFSSIPLKVNSMTAWGKPSDLASGRQHVCAIFGEGILACWGSNELGQLGTGFEGDTSNAPVRVLREVNGVRTFIGNAKQVVAGEVHTCVLAAGKVECWGDNGLGELGEDPDQVGTRDVARPVPGLEGIAVDELAASSAHTCARAGTDVYCWGSNLFGELAKAEGFFGTPTHIPLPSNIVSITAGRFFGCALSSDGTARCWGSNAEGQLAQPDTPSGAAPVQIPLPNIAGIYGGDGRHACAVSEDASTWCWGRNNFGQLGNNGVSDKQSTPQLVRSLNLDQVCGL